MCRRWNRSEWLEVRLLQPDLNRSYEVYNYQISEFDVQGAGLRCSPIFAKKNDTGLGEPSANWGKLLEHAAQDASGLGGPSGKGIV